MATKLHELGEPVVLDDEVEDEEVLGMLVVLAAAVDAAVVEDAAVDEDP